MGSQFLQLVATGITIGSVYALLGLALTLTFSTTRVVNVAIGEFAMIGALSAASFVAAGVPLLVAAGMAVFIGAAAGVVMYLLAIRPAQARGGSILTLLMVTIALSLALRGIGLAIWGTRAYELPPFVAGPPVEILSAVVTRQSLFVLVVTLAHMVALYLFFSRTKTGKALLACAANTTGARLVGIPVAAMGMLAFALSTGLAAAAGVLITPDALATYDMGFLLGLKGFVGAVIGRLHGYGATVVGCLGLGVIEALSAGLISSGYRDAIAFLVLILVLIWRALPALRGGVLATEEAE